jgi:hypothetical protein
METPPGTIVNGSVLNQWRFAVNSLERLRGA